MNGELVSGCGVRHRRGETVKSVRGRGLWSVSEESERSQNQLTF